MGPPGRPRRQTAAVRGFGHRDCPPLAEQALVPPPVRDGLRDHRLPPDPRPLLPVAAARARGGRTSRLEHRGLPPPRIPAWQLMRSGDLHKGLHLPQRGALGAVPAALLPKSRRPPPCAATTFDFHRAGPRGPTPARTSWPPSSAPASSPRPQSPCSRPPCRLGATRTTAPASKGSCSFAKSRSSTRWR